MNIARNLFAALAVASVCGCVSATVSVDNICASHDITLPGNGTGLPVPAGFVVSQSFPVSVSDALSKVKDVGDLSVSINSFTLNDGDFSWVSHVKADATGSDMSMAPLTLVDTDVASATNTINLPISADAQAQFIEMLKTGDVSITVYLTTGNGTLPTSDENITGTLCVAASVDVKKSL